MVELLLVDDDEINNFLLKHLLRKSNYALNISAFTSPVEALIYMKQCHADLKKIDLLLLDVNMPVLTGWEVLNDLRLNGITMMEDIKIYMLSSSVHATDLDKAKEYQEVSGFISKPISMEILSDIFNEIMTTKVG
jgi:CheY-like chemotaxis protein